MAQTATMGPPLSPRETRRSGRRSVPSVSASTSKSPDSDQPPREKPGLPRVPSATANNRNKKLKQEDYDEAIEDRKQHATTSATSSGSNNGANNNKAKRKPKEKQASNGDTIDTDVPAVEGQGEDPAEEEEEQGITRCVCGSAEDDPDAGEFMVQCETCKVWQHGLCMGYTSEDQVHDDDYYCELCKPEQHTALLGRLAKKRQSSTTSRQDTTANSRVSRSHSPTFLLKQQVQQTSKRRNTMNSRDAAFDESLKEIIEATAAEAAAVNDTSLDDSNISLNETVDNGKKKRKRTDDDNTSKKRTRSASTASDGQIATVPPLDPPPSEKIPSQVPKSTAARNRRGGRKIATAEAATVETEEVPVTSSKRPTNSSRAKGTSAPKRPPLSTAASHGSGAAAHEHGTRRIQSGVSSNSQQGATTAADARAYRHSHAYAVSQQALFTSWNLPDYLSHLEQMLPTDTPQPLEVRSAASAGGAGSREDSAERTMERGVKVKWPAKRMSVGDMNKRVRSLVEWVGREQASAQDRGRRREALEKSLREQAEALTEPIHTSENQAGTDAAMVVDDSSVTTDQVVPLTKGAISSQLMSESALEMSAQTMKMMEELMEELIGFQERFGPGAKSSRERERRLAV